MSNTVDEYQFDCPDPEGGQARALAHKETDFYRILENLLALNQEEDIVNSVDDLILAKSYLIILRDDNKIQAIGFKTLPESWKIKVLPIVKTKIDPKSARNFAASESSVNFR